MNDALLDSEQKVLLIGHVIEAFPLPSLPVFHFPTNTDPAVLLHFFHSYILSLKLNCLKDMMKAGCVVSCKNMKTALILSLYL